ncbi:MAG: diacylglycerol kinase family protein [Planctomycetota bacterium]|nr:diacylglycerol kinase family protein [Planctomycetota bacterium]
MDSPTTRSSPGSSPRFASALVVANPIAGKGRGEAAARDLAAGLERLGTRVDLRLTAGAGDAKRWATERPGDVDLAVSIGGDGTLRELLDGLTNSGGGDLPVATLPMGTANVLALDFRLPRHVPGLLEVIEAGHTRLLDLAEVRSGESGPSMTSFLAIGIGLDANVVHRLDAARTGTITKLSYVPHVLSEVRSYRPAVLRVAVDGEPLEGTFGQVIVSNMIHYGGFLKLDPETRSDDGRWELYLWRDASRRALAASTLRGTLGRIPGGACQRLHARQVSVSSESPVPYHVDGDPGGMTPLALRLTGRRQAILAPK